MVLQFIGRKGFILHGNYFKKTLQILTPVFGWLYFTQCVTSFCSIDHLCLYAWFFDSILYNIAKVFSINPSADVFVFGEFNAHHNDCLTDSGGTDRPGELCYNCSISNGLTQMVNVPTQIPDCDSHRPAFLFFSFLWC